MKIIRILALLIAAFALTPSNNASAQSNQVSPYSRYGYGLISEQANTAQRAMGGVGYAMRSGRQINFMNPASYAAIDSLTFLFDMGLDLKHLSTSDGDAKGSSTTGGLDYITMQVPITKWLGASAGLIPYSEVGYSFGNEITNGVNSHTGSGGINQLYLGFGARPFKGLSLGFNVAYMFGTITNDTYIYGTSTSLFERVTEIRDYDLRFGIQYGLTFLSDHTVTLGAVFAPEKWLRGTTYGEVYDVTNDTDPSRLDEKKLLHNAKTAATYGIGLNYSWRNRLMAEADFTYQPWKNTPFANLQGFNDAIGKFDNRWKANIGFQFQDRQRGTWLQRVSYRIGAYYANDYIKVGDNSVRETGVTLGFGLPAPSSKSVANLSFEYRNRKATPNPLVKENYFVVTLGINFNELWFYRNKID